MIELIHADCLKENGLCKIKTGTVDIILTDPPYKYLKNQKLEVNFDEQRFFYEAKRVLKKDGFIVLFGRGSSFYRWNTILANLGFNFKEEIVWDKSYCSSPLMAISRVHETISIHSKGKGVINKVKIPYLEMKGHNLDSIITDIKRLKTTFQNTKSFDAVMNYLSTNNVSGNGKRKNLSTSVSSHIEEKDRCASVMQAITDGMSEKTIIRSDRIEGRLGKELTVRNGILEGDRAVNAVNSITQGMNEKTIIREIRDHYATIHPTQKPVRLLERLLALTTKEGDLVIDPFAGSFSTAEACVNLKRRFKGWELDEEYFNKGRNRINEIQNKIELCLKF